MYPVCSREPTPACGYGSEKVAPQGLGGPCTRKGPGWLNRNAKSQATPSLAGDGINRNRGPQSRKRARRLSQ